MAVKFQVAIAVQDYAAAADPSRGQGQMAQSNPRLIDKAAHPTLSTLSVRKNSVDTCANPV